MNKFFNFFIFLSFFTIAIESFVNKSFYLKYHENINLGKGYIYFGLLFLIVSLYFLYLSYKQYQIEKSKKNISHSICPKCEETFNYYELKDGMCPYCDIPTKDLDGYYSKKEDNK